MQSTDSGFDMIFCNGRVLDGSGNPWFRADVGVRKDRIAAVGRLRGATAKRTVDISGKMICPGFIDVHVHSEIGLLTGEAAEARIRQGVTTDVFAADGLSYAPVSKKNQAETRRYLAIFHGDPDLAWNWGSYGEYLDQFRGRTAINIVPQIPFNALRLDGVGWEPRPATPKELAKMKRLTREIMEDGAAGIATGMEYFPSAHATVEELTEICRIVGEYGGVHSTHLRGYGQMFPASLQEVVSIAEATGTSIQIAHLAMRPEKYRPVEEARDRGIDVSFDAYPYMAGCTHLIYCLPAWAQCGVPSGVLARLSDPAMRERLRPEINTFFTDREFTLDDIVFSSTGTASNEHLVGQTLAQAVRDSGKDLTDFICDLLSQEELRVLAIFHWHDEERLRAAMTHPLRMACSDGMFFRGGRPHPRGYGAFPRMLAYVVREKGWLRWEDAVRQMTSFPATKYRLRDRGLVRPGMAADLVIFDPDTVSDRSTYEDGRRLAEGIDYVAVNGKLVLDAGTMTPVRPGRVLKAS